MKLQRKTMSLLYVPRGAIISILVFLAAIWFAPLRADDDDNYVTDQVVVKLNLAGGATIGVINSAYGTSTLETLLDSSAIYLLQIGPGQSVEAVVDAMKDDPRLIYAEPNFISEMPEGDPSGTWGWGGHDPGPYFGQYAADLLNLPEAHTVTHGAGVTVAVLDTGLQLDHPRFSGRLTAARYDFIEDDSVPDDDANGLDDDLDGLTDEGAGHGTHVAGSINLVAPEARIMPLRVLDSDGYGNDFLLAEAIQFAAANGADVINLSLGMPLLSELLEDIIGQTVSDGIVVVAAAGNINSSVEQYPAAFENVLSVSSVGPTSEKSAFANYGSWIDVAAPGDSIISAFPPDGYAQWSGTSMATSFISGQAVLIRSEFPTMTVAAVSSVIRSTAHPIDGAGDQMGAGVADIGASVGAFPDGPATLHCGQIVARSVLLANDLHNCPGDGLVVGAGGITINLNGHTLDGVGLGAGVRNDGHDSVAIINGTIQEFDFGVQLNPGTASNNLSALMLEHNQEAGILLSGDGSSGGNTIRYNTIAGDGIHMQNATHNTLEANTFVSASNIAVLLEGASHNTLIDNTITQSSDTALAIVAASNNNHVEGNTVLGSSDSGIVIAESNGNDLLFNMIQNGSDSGIVLDNAHDNVLRGNDLRFNAGGIELNTSTGNLIESNDVGHSTGTGIEIQGESLGNAIVLNAASFNGAEGISVEAEILPESTEPGNLIDRNTASNNQSRGISVTKAGHTIKANIAENNDNWGIYAEAGNVDGGGNVATGNLELPQCFNISCGDGSPPPPPPDTTPPETIINSGPDATTTATGATFTFSAGEPGTSFHCSLNSGSFAPCISPVTYSSLTIGSHEFRVRATDAAGNADPSPAVYRWTVLSDCGAPVTLFAVADAWIDQGKKTANKGSESMLNVQAKGKNANRVLVRFVLPVIPEGCVIQSATLQFYSASWVGNRTLHAIRIKAPWSETSVNWKNQPPTTGAAATTTSGAGYRQWNVTSHLQAMYSTGTNYGFLIRDRNEKGKGFQQQFHSREMGENPPLLIITYVPSGD